MLEYIVKVYEDGTKKWYLNGKIHREDGPAVEWASGDKKWYINGKLHREDGPAFEGSDGTKYWYINGVEYTEDEFNRKVTSAPQELTVAEIEAKLGYTVKVVKG